MKKIVTIAAIAAIATLGGCAEPSQPAPKNVKDFTKYYDVICLDGVQYWYQAAANATTMAPRLRVSKQDHFSIGGYECKSEQPNNDASVDVELNDDGSVKTDNAVSPNLTVDTTSASVAGTIEAK